MAHEQRLPRPMHIPEQTLWTVRRRMAVVANLMSGERTIEEACDEHGLKPEIIRRWLSMYERHGLPVSAPLRPSVTALIGNRS